MGNKLLRAQLKKEIFYYVKRNPPRCIRIYVNSKSFFHVNPNSIILAMTKILIVNVWEIPIISRFNDTLL